MVGEYRSRSYITGKLKENNLSFRIPLFRCNTGHPDRFRHHSDSYQCFHYRTLCRSMMQVQYWHPAIFRNYFIFCHYNTSHNIKVPQFNCNIDSKTVFATIRIRTILFHYHTSCCTIVQVKNWHQSHFRLVSESKNVLPHSKFESEIDYVWASFYLFGFFF